MQSVPDSERQWWSSPYLRMLSSPIRICTVTRRYFPSDLLVRLAPFRNPLAKPSLTESHFLPDGLEHPKFSVRENRTAIYVRCHKAAFDDFANRAALRRFAPNPKVHGSLKIQIGHLLRLRVLQEIKVLANTLRSNRQATLSGPVLRRLTRSEWEQVKATGSVPFKNAIAIIVAPPPNRDPKTKLRPQPWWQPTLPDSQLAILQDSASQPSLPSLPPVSELLAHVNNSSGSLDEIPNVVPNSRVPLYNATSLCPLPGHRAALHEGLSDILNTERHNRRFVDLSETLETTTSLVTGPQKSSHAFLLRSDEDTLTRADPVPLAIALWRVRLWEGEAENQSYEDGWEMGAGWRRQYAATAL
ncbi:hypothetical protein CONPUDRAFT_55254 [Coniophora puteana RWD-64-598 SS2]|uniref:Uncharacterized protein n=1 Tax=Coniophora puteana (strain RWD-64-598) TaxID=741705 RepID=A0A5M3MTK3_CONPW|nr:uncharacterized protein CONPUDRAFT_55254 [Coniophora puteana RWD-64-598 SS2]EIW82426.1 hypothetical protein CONPUDRAFT_55254 [Coniophora puteana RWD-64-598 SS2]